MRRQLSQVSHLSPCVTYLMKKGPLFSPFIKEIDRGTGSVINHQTTKLEFTQ
jgi:hypothetical protein